MINFLFRLVLLLAVLDAFPASAQSSLRQTPLGFCSMSSMSAATALSSCQVASFTGSGSTAGTTTLTVTSSTGLLSPGLVLSGTGITSGTIIVSQTTIAPSTSLGGGAGTYLISLPSTSSAATITASGPPTQATYAILCAYTQGVNWRDDGVAPTGTTGTGGQGIASGSCIPYNGNFSAFQAIQQTSGAILGVTFYK